MVSNELKNSWNLDTFLIDLMVFGTWILFKFDSKTKSFVSKRITHTKLILLSKQIEYLKRILLYVIPLGKVFSKTFAKCDQNPYTKHHQINTNSSKLYGFQSIWWCLVHGFWSDFENILKELFPRVLHTQISVLST